MIPDPLSIFTASTAVVALAEIGDKTMLLAIVLAARLRAHWQILAGILVATLANHGLAALIGQEAIHSRVHNEWNEVLAQHKFPVPLYRFLGGKVFEYGFNRFPQPLKLSMMAGIEHFTAVLAEFMMKHEENFFQSDDEKQRALWMWHMLEESEHKDIAYDVYQTLNGSYPLRVAGFLIAAITIVALVPFAATLIPVIRRPANLLSPDYWRDGPCVGKSVRPQGRPRCRAKARTCPATC